MPRAGSHYNLGTSRGPDKIESRAGPGPRAASCTWLLYTMWHTRINVNTCVSLFYSTAFVIVIRLVYKNLRYWPIRIYFGMLANDCCITFIQWKARTQELLSHVRDVCYFDFGSLPFFKDWIYVRLRLCYCYSALCLTLIQTWGTLVVTGKDDNVSGFSECEICDVCVSLVICVFTDWRKRTRHTLSIRLIA